MDVHADINFVIFLRNKKHLKHFKQTRSLNKKNDISNNHCMMFKVKALFFDCLFVCLFFAVTSYLFLVSEDLLSKKMPLNKDKKKTCQKLLLVWISNGTTAFYDSDDYVDAGSFYAAFWLITSNKVPSIKCLIMKADTTTDKDTLHHTLFSVIEPQRGLTRGAIC